MDILRDLNKVYNNDGKIEELTMSKGNQSAINYYSMTDESILNNLISAIKHQSNPKMKQ